MIAYLFTKRNKIVRPLCFPSTLPLFPFFRFFRLPHAFAVTAHSKMDCLHWIWMGGGSGYKVESYSLHTWSATVAVPLENYFPFREMASTPQWTNLNPNGVETGWINLFALLSFQSKCVLFELRCVWTNLPCRSIQSSSLIFHAFASFCVSHLFCFPHSTHD